MTTCDECNLPENHHTLSCSQRPAHWDRRRTCGIHTCDNPAHEIKSPQLDKSVLERIDPAECVRLCEAIAAFWGDDVCTAPLWPGAYITEEDVPISELVRKAIGWRRP